MNNTTTNTQPKNQPVDSIRLSNIEVSIWANRDSEGKLYHSVTLQRSYKNDQGYQSSGSLFQRDLPIASKALDMAFDRIRELEAQPPQVHVA